MTALSTEGNTATVFRKATVAEILASPGKFDQKLVELRGRIVVGQEISMFQDGSTCAKIRMCALWVELDRCMIAGSETENSCAVYIDNLVRLNGGPPLSQRIELDDVAVRGVVMTSRKDLRYDSSVPKQYRVGQFGHLSAYPGQVNVQQIQLPPSAK